MGVITERERQKYFAYLDGVADGLNETRNDVNSVLDNIRTEIANIPQTDSDGHSGNWYREPQSIIDDAINIIDKYKAESGE